MSPADNLRKIMIQSPETWMTDWCAETPFYESHLTKGHYRQLEPSFWLLLIIILKLMRENQVYILNCLFCTKGINHQDKSNKIPLPSMFQKLWFMTLSKEMFGWESSNLGVQSIADVKLFIIIHLFSKQWHNGFLAPRIFSYQVVRHQV